MPEVVTFVGYRPPARYDSIPWTEARIEEADSEAGTFVQLEVIALTPDADPSVPAARNFTTELGTAIDYWYRIVWADATADTSVPTSPVQNITGSDATVEPYATVDELARILKIRNPSAEQEAAMDRVLTVAAGEVTSEIDRTASEALSGWQLALAAEVNLERAVEHWRQQESPFGLVGLGAEFGAAHTSKDSWDRHAHKLAPLKSQWGLA